MYHLATLCDFMNVLLFIILYGAMVQHVLMLLKDYTFAYLLFIIFYIYVLLFMVTYLWEF